MTESGLNWCNCVSVITVGAAKVKYQHSGLVQKVRKVAANAVPCKCILCCQALAAIKLVKVLNEVLNRSNENC